MGCWARLGDVLLWAITSCRSGIIVEVLLASFFCPPAHRPVYTQVGQGLLVCLHTIHFDRAGNELWAIIGHCTWIAEGIVDVFLALGIAEMLRLWPRLVLTHPMAVASRSTKGTCASRSRASYLYRMRLARVRVPVAELEGALNEGICQGQVGA